MLRRDPNVDLVSFFILRTETDEQPWNHDDLSLIPFPTFEIFEEQLRSFDLVIFQNFNYAPYGVEPFLPNVRDYVEEGGAIAMIGGDLSFASGGYGLTALRDVLPVELPAAPPTLEGETDASLTTDLFKPRLTPEGHTHPVTSLLLDARENEARWGKLPRARRDQPGATGQAERRHAAGPPDAQGRRRQAGAGPGGGRRRQRAGAGVADRLGVALGVPGGRRRGRRPGLPAVLGERDPLAGARSRAHAAAHRPRTAGVPTQPADLRAGARRARRLHAGGEHRGDRRRRRRRQRRGRQAAPQPPRDDGRRRRSPGRGRRASPRRLPADRARDDRRTRRSRRTRPSWCGQAVPSWTTSPRAIACCGSWPRPAAATTATRNCRA